MRVKDFYKQRECDKKQKYDTLTIKDKRPLLLQTAINEVAQMLKERKDKEQCENILLFLNQHLSYEPKWFDCLGRDELLKSDDITSFKRLITFLWRYKVIDSNVNCSVKLSGIELSQVCHLIVEDKEGNKHAFIINKGKTDHSKGGKSNMTCTSTRLEALVVKRTLEKKYPKINVAFLYLRNATDSDGKLTEEFLITNTKTSNVLYADFSAYYEEGAFQEEAFDALIEDVMSEKVKKPCSNCAHARLCNLKSISELKAVEVQEKPYELPKYTAEQEEVINTSEGQIVCIAGPGSGKTATLVGRIANLCKKTQPERILAITYTKKAAKELLTRCKSFCKEDSMPYISTIHSFCYEVLRANKDVTEREFRALSPYDSLMLIDNLLYSYPPIAGIKYGKKYGRYGTLKTVERKLQLYGVLPLEEFQKKNNELDNNFYSLAEQYYEAIRENGFITYDQMIVETINLFNEHPEVLKGYQNLYKYIMVDEYQDVNKDNAELIYQLAGENGNLCIVGDDDQAIYGFRGGSNKYMLSFDSVYKDAKKVLLSNNFRSQKAIVDLAEKVVEKNERFNKTIHAVKEYTVKPRIIATNTATMLDELITSLVIKGYKYSEIAILSTQNAPLEQLHDTLKAPSILAKTMLVDSAEFILLNFALEAMNLADEEISNDLLLPAVKILDAEYLSYLDNNESIINSFKNDIGFAPSIHNYPMLCVYEIEGEAEKLSRGTALLRELAKYVDAIKHSTISNIVENLETAFGGKTPVTESIYELIQDREVKDLESLKTLTSNMILLEDETRVDLNTAEAVTLITTHESKGKEWPCVIIQNLEAYKNDEESRRLLYVAMTRAKDILYLARDKASRLEIEFDSDFVEVAI